jgi:hypothetical protein
MRLLAPALLLLLGAAAPGEDRSYMVTSFDRLRVDGPFQVEVRSGSSPQARAEGERAALERLDLHVEGTTLVVSAKADGWRLPTGETPSVPQVSVTIPALRTVLVNGGGRVRIARMAGDRVDLGLNGAGVIAVDAIDAGAVNATLTGTGAITLAGKSLRARLRSNGAGTIDAGALTTGEGTVIAETAGQTRLGARYKVRVFALGSGGVEIVGTPECVISGPGPVTCPGKVTRAN